MRLSFMKLVLILLGSFSIAFAKQSLSLVAMPLVGHVELSKSQMLDFTVINNNAALIEAKADIVDLTTRTSFAKDQFKPGVNFDLSNDVSVSPSVFLIKPHSSQLVRVFVKHPPQQPGDYFFGVKFVPTKNIGENAPAVKNGRISVPIYLGQLTAVYVHHGQGQPQATVSCQFMQQHKQLHVILDVHNTSRWLFNPKYTVSLGQKVLQSDLPTLPVLGESHATRYLLLKKIQARDAPVAITWQLKNEKSQHIECQRITKTIHS